MHHSERQRIARRRRTIALGILLVGAMLPCGPCAFALDPSLDISQYAHTSWKMRDGFTNGAITSIAQTPDGYLWLGTEFGLYRFDGIRAVPWRPPQSQQLPDNYIRDLLVARDGTLWIAMVKGLASWKDGKLTTYPETAGQLLLSLIEDRKGAIWFGTRTPARLCAVQGHQVQCYGVGTLGRFIVALYEDHNGNLWVTAETGVWRWAPGPPQQYTLPRGTVEINSLTETEDGSLLLATDDGLKQLSSGKVQSYAVPGIASKFRPNRFFRSRDGALWVGTQQGLLHMHQGKTDPFTAADGLSGNFVNCIFEDREGNVWVSTQGGLDRFREYAIPTVSLNQGLSTPATHSVQATTNGTVWIGTASGLVQWQNGRGSVYGARTERGHSAGHSEDGLAGAPRSLGQDDQGRLYVSTNGGMFNLEGNRFIRVPMAPAENIWFIAGDGHGKLWVNDGTAGLFHFKPGETVEPIPWSRFGQRGYGAESVLPDRSNGGLWLGFEETGVAYFKDGQIRASFTSIDGLGKGRVNDLRFGASRTVWAATEGGLSRIKDGHITTLTSKNGLPCDYAHWSIEDNEDFVWLYMTCGLVRIARSELDAWVIDPKHIVQNTLFDPSDGIRTIGFYGGYGPHVTKAPDGKIWFIPYDGVSVIDPRHLPYNKIPPPVHIEQITADSQTYDASQGLKLPPLMRDLTINYTALSLVVPEKVRFRVRLEGQDKDWRELTDRRAHYTNLAPKHYRFQVKACNNSGVWNEEGAALDFAILPAFYQTSWFRALCVAAFMALLWCIYRIRIGILERRQQLLERHQGEITALNERLMKAQEEERSRIAGELHDGVLQQITSVSLMLGAVKLQVPREAEAKEKIRELQKKLIDVGTDIRQLSHELHPATLQDSGLPGALCAYCDEFSKTRGIPVSCETDDSVRDLSPGAALCIYRIAQEALGNVAKHSKAKKVQVRLTRADGRVRLSVSDDGVGFASDRPSESGGLGLINMRERVRQLHGTLELESVPGRGTTVRAEVPFRPAP